MGKGAFCCSQHPKGGWELYHLTAIGEAPEDRTTVSFVPEMGCNVCSFGVGGQQYLVDVDSADEERKLLGTPILYPTPNRVRNATMTFEGREFHFPANNGPHFIHGLVRDVPWHVGEPRMTDEGVAVTASVSCAPGTDLHQRFPIANTLTVTIALRPRRVRLAFAIRNDDQSARLPFGLAIHPYFAIIGPRESVRITVPATKWMEADALIPTGRLLDLEQGPADLNRATSLADLDLDDVYWGASPEQPQIVDYPHSGKRLTLRADPLFTHCVVYTPRGKPYFCIENQSCSTDAHNLYARGLQQEAHLTVLDPGEQIEAAVEFSVDDL